MQLVLPVLIWSSRELFPLCVVASSWIPAAVTHSWQPRLRGGWASLWSRWRILLCSSPVENSLQVEVAGGTVCTSSGICKVRLQLQDFACTVTFSVVELAPQYEVILGEDWLALHQATLSWKHNCCVVIKSGRKFSIVQSHSAPVMQHTAGACAKLLTGRQARKAVA